MESVSSKSPQGKHYVYILAYPDGKVFYIGKGTFSNRIYAHEVEARSGKPSGHHGWNEYKIRTIRKIWDSGGQVVRTKLAYFATHEEALLYEMALIFFLPNLTNLTEGGEGTVGIPFSEERKRRLREANIGHSHSSETRQLLRERNLGKKMSEENRRKMIERNTGMVRSEKTRQRISESKKGRKHTEETRQKMSEKAKLRQWNKRISNE